MKQPATDAGAHRVFADPRGRRRAIIRWLAIGVGGTVCAYVTVVAVGLLGGPEVPVLPWPDQHAAHGSPAVLGTGARQTSPAHNLAGQAAPVPGGTAGRSPSPSPQAQPTALPSVTATTNHAGKTPPGQNRSPSPHRTRPA